MKHIRLKAVTLLAIFTLGTQVVSAHEGHDHDYVEDKVEVAYEKATLGDEFLEVTKEDTSSSRRKRSADDDTSKWSIIPFTLNEEVSRNSEKIVIDPASLYTTPTRYAPDKSSDEVTRLEAMQYWETWLFYGNNNGYAKVVASDLDPSNENLRRILKLQDDAAFYERVMQANYADIWYVVSNAYSSVLTEDLYEIFGSNYTMTPTMIAQIKGAKLRADIAYEKLVELKPESDYINTYKDLTTYYNRIITIYDGYNNPGYADNVIVDEDVPGLEESELTSYKEMIAKFPLPIRQLFVDTRFVGEKGREDEKLTGILGIANNNRYIRLVTSYNGMNETALHEVGHIVDYMSAVYKKGQFTNSFSRTPEFQKVWQEGFTYERDYFRLNVAEGFAEGFGRYLQVRYLDGDRNKLFNQMPGVYEYFDKLHDDIFGSESIAATTGGFVETEDSIVESQESKVVKRRINYELPWGEQASASVFQEVTFTRTKYENESTGDVWYSEWTSENPTFEEVLSPAVYEHHTTVKSVPSKTVAADTENEVVTVVYERTEKVIWRVDNTKVDDGIRHEHMENGVRVFTIYTKPYVKTVKLGWKTLYYLIETEVDTKTGQITQHRTRVPAP